jgi:hypothetical protein
MKITRFAFVLTICIIASFAFSADKQTKKNTAEPAASVDLFEAIDSGLVEARVVAENSLDGKIIFKNKTKEPLEVRLPETFAAVPLHQFDDFAGGGAAGNGGTRGGGNRNNNGNNGGNQMMGGGYGGGGYGSGMGGGMGGMWSVASETLDKPAITLLPAKYVKKNIKTVCLEHGKKEPAKHIEYVLKPIDEALEKGKIQNPEEVKLLCNLVGNGVVDQKAGQAAVWHYANGLSWEELAAKTRKKAGAPTQLYFSRQQMTYAVTLGKKVETQVAQDAKAKKVLADDDRYAKP